MKTQYFLEPTSGYIILRREDLSFSIVKMDGVEVAIPTNYWTGEQIDSYLRNGVWREILEQEVVLLL